MRRGTPKTLSKAIKYGLDDVLSTHHLKEIINFSRQDIELIRIAVQDYLAQKFTTANAWSYKKPLREKELMRLFKMCTRHR
jgi:hypothetical protein